MKRIACTTLALSACAAALSATSAGAEIISQPTNTYSLPNLSGELTGGNQTQYLGETFTAPITGNLTKFQFTLNTSSLASVYGVVFAWNGTAPTTELYRSVIRPGAAGLFDFAPTGVQLTQGQTYVAFLSTYGIAGNSGLATLGTCLPFANCSSNTIPNLGTFVTGNVLGTGVAFSSLNYLDATFSATVSAAAVPEPITWAMMVVGFGAVGFAMRRRQKVSARVTFA